MTPTRTFALAIALGAATPTAAADLTPRGLFDLWQDQAAEQGRTVTAQAIEDGAEGLALRGLEVEQVLDDTTFAATIPLLTLRQTDAGVTATLASGQAITVTVTEADTPPTTARLDVREGPLTLTASGAAPSPDYAVAAEAFALDLAALDGPDVPGDAAWSMGLAGLAGTLAGGSGGDPLTADLTLARLSTDLAATDPATGGTFATSLAQNAMTAALALVPAATGGDWAFDLRTASGPSTTLSRQTDPESGTIETESRQASTRLSMALRDGRATYGSTATGLDLVVRADGLPVPQAEFSAAAADLALSLPTEPGPDPQAARLQADIEALTANEAVWDMLDPGGALPRGPATVVVDLGGDVVVGDAAATAEMPDGLPDVLPRTLDIDTLSLDFAGAEIDAEGAFTLRSGADGAPDLSAPPVGALTVTGRGITEFLGQLIAGGMVTQEQAMGMQMMLGMFATQRPDGALETRIVTTEEGGIEINGNRIR